MSILSESAKGQSCFIRIPGYCNFRPETTVLCHENGAGEGIKHIDLRAAFGCSDCHGVLDGRIKTNLPIDAINLYFMHGVMRTLQWWSDNGYILICKPTLPKVSEFGLGGDDFFN